MIKNSFFILLCTCIGLCAACGKWEEEPVTSYLKLIHASPDIKEIYLLADGNKLDEQSISYTKSSSDYAAVRAGKRNLSVSQIDGTIPFVIQDAFLTQWQNYSVFVAKNPKEKDTLLVQADTLIVPAINKSRIRFANLFPQLKDTTLNFIRIGIATPAAVFSNRKFGNISGFIEVDAASNYVFALQKNNVTIPNLSLTISLESGKIYTIMALDSVNSSSVNTKKMRMIAIRHN